jgi:hypothetical protein
MSDLSEVTRDLGTKPHGKAGQSILPKSAMPYGNCPICGKQIEVAWLNHTAPGNEEFFCSPECAEEKFREGLI